jgi:hypothetical protein
MADRAHLPEADADDDDADARLYTSEPLEDENGTRYVIRQQNVGPGNELGHGEWPDPNTPPQSPAPGAAESDTTRTRAEARAGRRSPPLIRRRRDPG